MSNGITTEVNLVDFYIEMHHMRGNVSKFEVYNTEGEEWVEMAVWDFRPGKVADNFWTNVAQVDNVIRIIDNALGNASAPLYRVTRFPELEKDLLDTTYHPSVSSDHINPTYVEGLLYND